MKHPINSGCLLSLFALTFVIATACGDDETILIPQQPGTAPTATPSPSAAPAPTSSPSVTPTPSPMPSPSTSPSVTISIQQGATGMGTQAYGTNPLQVSMGSTVTWINNDSAPHTVTADDGSFDSGSMQTGQSYSHTFSSAGTFPYYCTIHGKASMSGSVQVTP